MTPTDHIVQRRLRGRNIALRFQGAFTLVELLIVICVLGILAALLLPTLKSTLKRARGVQCMSSLRQLYIGATQFAADNQGAMPYNETNGSPSIVVNFWMYSASDYALGNTGGQTGELLCPDGPWAKGKQVSAARVGQGNYGMNPRFLCIKEITTGSVVGVPGFPPRDRLFRFYDVPTTAVLYFDSGAYAPTQERAMEPAPAWGYIPGYSKNKSVSSFYASNPKVTVDAHEGRHGKTINYVRADGSGGQATAEDFVTNSQYWNVIAP